MHPKDQGMAARTRARQHAGAREAVTLVRGARGGGCIARSSTLNVPRAYSSLCLSTSFLFDSKTARRRMASESELYSAARGVGDERKKG